MGRTLVILVALISSGLAQIPDKLRARLSDKSPYVRERAVTDLGRIKATTPAASTRIATLLAEALKDKDQDVRLAAAGLLGADRPGEIAVPSLLKGLYALEGDGEALFRDIMSKSERMESSERERSYLQNLGKYGNAILDSLETHWDERVVLGVAQAVAAWKLHDVPGITVQHACELLCRFGTKPALDAVADLIARAQSSAISKPPAGGVVLQAPIDVEQLDRIVLALDVALQAARVVKPPGFNRQTSSEWKALLVANAERFPPSLPESRPSSRSASRPAK